MSVQAGRPPSYSYSSLWSESSAKEKLDLCQPSATVGKLLSKRAVGDIRLALGNVADSHLESSEETLLEALLFGGYTTVWREVVCLCVAAASFPARGINLSCVLRMGPTSGGGDGDASCVLLL